MTRTRPQKAALRYAAAAQDTLCTARHTLPLLRVDCIAIHLNDLERSLQEPHISWITHLQYIPTTSFTTTMTDHTIHGEGQKAFYAKTDMGWGPKYGPFTYRHMSEPYLSEELMRLSLARSQDEIDSVTFQPSLDPDQRIQDRRVVQKWDIGGGGIWTFTAVFDGQPHRYLC